MMLHASDLRKLPPWAGLLLAGGLVAVTLLLRWGLAAYVDNQSIMIVFVLPIIVGAYLGGIKTGLAATVAAAISSNYFLLPPVYSLAILKPADQVQWGLLWLIGIAVSLFAEDLIRSCRQAEASCERMERLSRNAALFPEENPYPVMRAARGGELLYANRAAAKLLEQWQCPAGARVPEVMQRELAAALESGNPQELELRCGDRELSFVLVPIADRHYVNFYGRDITAQKSAQEALRKSERLYRAIGESIDYGVWVCAADGRNLYASESFLKMVGITQQQCSDFGWGDVLHPEDAERTIAAWKECVRTGGTWDIEHRFRGADGQWHAVLARGVPVKNEKGEILCWAGINLDIRRFKQTEQELEAARAEAVKEKNRLEAVMEALPVGVAITDVRGGHLKTNRAFEAIWGGSCPATNSVADYAAYKAWWLETGELVEPEEWGAARALRTGETITGKLLEIQRFNDARAFVISSASPIFDTAGEIDGCAVAIMDITELQEAEQALRAAHERLRTILGSISDGFISLDRQWRVSFVNERGAQDVGQTRESMLGRVLWEIFPEAVGSEFERAYQRAMTQRVTTTAEAYYPPLNAWFEARAYPSEDGISVFFRDITDRRRVEQILRENQADLNWAQSVGRIGSWRLNIQRNELLWSDENHRIFGLPKGTPMSYETFLGIVHPEDRDYVDRKWTAALRGEPYDIEHRLIVGNSVKWVRERAELEFDADGKLLGGFGITQDITEHKLADEALSKSEARFRLLAETAAGLLAASDPQRHVNDLAGRIMNHLDCHCFFNFLVAEEQPGRLRLNAWAGIPEEEAHRIEWLDYGVAVCGCVARDGVRIVAEHIPTTPDVRTELVKSYGIKAYACHPLVGVNGRLLGTLSFGTRSRETFSAEDLDLMKAVTDQVAVAMVRMQNERDLRNSSEALRQANEKLEEKVRIRTQELEDTVAALRNEILVRKKIQAELHHLSRKSLEALEADRRTVARELHDSIGGSLAAIKLGLEEAAEQALREPVEGAASLETLASHLADTIKETKRIAANLRPLAIDDLGLLATIEWYTRQFCQRYENIRVIRQIEVEEQDIPEEFKIVFYRVMQEAMTNAAKHSRADTVYIRLKKLASHFEFEVEDNGCGFNPDEVFARQDQLSGFGLKSMQERSEICGGVLNLHTQPDAGTSVRVALPIGTAASGF